MLKSSKNDKIENDEIKRETTPIAQGKYKAIVYLSSGEKIYASEITDSDNGVTGRISNYDGSDGGEFDFAPEYVKGIVRK